ncbi:MAG: glycerate kinase [Hyphomicrobiales bacterium]
MNIVICPDSFKESLGAGDVARAIECGFRRILPQASYRRVPMADGGEGTVGCVVECLGGEIVTASVADPWRRPVEAAYGLAHGGKTAIIEMAAASGLERLESHERNPCKTSSHGTGQLILAALDRGVERIILGLGGSATNDGGAGMARALGARFTDENGHELAGGGGALGKLAHVDLSGLDQRLSRIRFDVACDVDNPLCGAQGASAVFGPQKGADPRMVAELDANLRHYAQVIEKATGRDVADRPGAGAAGGVGAMLMALFDVTLRAGVEIVMEAVELPRALAEADLVLTGEGRIDGQTICGKTPIGVARAAKRHDVPVIGLAGAIADDGGKVVDHGIDAIFSVTPRVMELDEALEKTEGHIERTAEQIARLLLLARKLPAFGTS